MRIRICGFFILTSILFLAMCVSASDQPGATTVSSLPAAAQAKISATLGRDMPNYFVKATGSGLEATNRGQKLTTRFTSEGMEVRNGAARWGLALRGYGYGNALATVKAVAPQASANRVEYRRGPLTEWYVNGPVGLEQGFTLSQPSEKANGQPLTIALAVSGNMKMTVDEKRRSVSLNERDGNAALRYTGLTATDAKGKELRAWLEVKGERLLLKVEDAGARYPVAIDPWVQLAKLTPSDGMAGFGSAVAISGDTVVVGAPTPTWTPHAYVFIKPADGWATMTEAAQLTISDPDGTYVLLGPSVAIDRNTIVLGMLNWNGGETWGAYVYVKPKDGWKNTTETAKLTPTDASAWFGQSVAISGDTIVVGSPITGGPYFEDGAAYVFVKPPSGWANMTETAKLSPTARQEHLGSSVAISGDTVVAGAVGWNGSGRGAYVFVKPEGGWINMTPTAELTSSDGDGGFGGTVAIRTDTVVVGALVATVGSNANQGAAYVFVRPPSGWANMTETAKLTASDGAANDYFGASVSFGGYKVVVGASGADIGSNVDQGAAYVFAKPASGWVTTSKFNAKLRAPDGAAGDAFGSAVAVSKGMVVAGAPNATIGSNAQQGAAYVLGLLGIRSFDPPSGPVGTPVVITGTNLSHATAVRFGGVTATSFTVDSDTQVTATVPTGAPTGKIVIKTPGGIATSATDFTVTP